MKDTIDSKGKSTLYDKLDDLIKERKKQGITLDQIAKETKISKATLSKYCHGPDPSGIVEENSCIKSIGCVNLLKLANYFHVSVDWLLGLTEYRSFDPVIRTIVDYIDLDAEAINILHYCKDKDSQYYRPYDLHYLLELLLSNPFPDFFLHFDRYLNFENGMLFDGDGFEIDMIEDILNEGEEVNKDSLAKLGVYPIETMAVLTLYPEIAIDRIPDTRDFWELVHLKQIEKSIEKMREAHMKLLDYFKQREKHNSN